MSQQRITGQPIQVHSVPVKEASLKTGQIVEGKVAKLYPNQMALIQVGSRQMVAQLETPLTVGERYHFQVSVSEDTVYLKVLGEQSSKNPEKSLAQLMTRLGITAGKPEIAFVKNLIDQHIPFQKEQVKQALTILNGLQSNKPEAVKLLQNMIANKIPVTPDTFMALFTKQTKGLNEVLKQALQAFTKPLPGARTEVSQVQVRPATKEASGQRFWDKIQNKLTGNIQAAERQQTAQPQQAGTVAKAMQNAAHIIGKLSDRPQFLSALVNKQLAPILSNNTALFEAFKDAGLIKSETPFSNWKSEWTAFVEKNITSFKQADSQIPPLQQQTASKGNIPSMGSTQGAALAPGSQPAKIIGQAQAPVINETLNQTRTAEPLTNLPLSNKLASQDIAARILNQNEVVLKGTVLSGKPMPAADFTLLAKQIQQRLLPLLSTAESTLLNGHLRNNSESLKNMTALLENLSAVNTGGKQIVSSLPFNMKMEEVVAKLGQHIENKAIRQEHAEQILTRHGMALKEAEHASKPMPARDFAVLARQVEQRLLPHLPATEAANMRNLLQNNSDSLKNLVASLEKMITFNTARPALELIQAKLQNNSLFTLPQHKDQLLTHIRQVLDESGMAHEQKILHGETKQAAQDLKSQLLTLDRAGQGPVQEAGRQLLHFINGMQLQSVSQNEHFIQASLQLPGGALGLAKDATLDFEGKRNEDGSINPEFCRILFYLHLEHLQETVIDMNVHKGNVSVTVYNDNERLTGLSKTLAPLLENGLASMDYKLASLTIKSHAKREAAINMETGSEEQLHPRRDSAGKVDYRV